MGKEGQIIHYIEQAWAIIPARGDSKSIPLKNLALLGSHPLIEYVIRAAKASTVISRMICSTENEAIAKFCGSQKVEIHRRPKRLAKDGTAVLDVLQHLLRDIHKKEGYVAEFIILLQPTSPFVLPQHIDGLVSLLKGSPKAQSAQTISPIPHNFHAFNQRVIEQGWLKFRFDRERRIFYNKQKKPKFYRFGNLVVSRGKTILEEGTIFGKRSVPLEIPEPYAMDVDGPEDLKMANMILEGDFVSLPYFALSQER
jgi:CMP-N,N'-diacetyllegionaminic acid synthase